MTRQSTYGSELDDAEKLSMDNLNDILERDLGEKMFSTMTPNYECLDWECGMEFVVNEQSDNVNFLIFDVVEDGQWEVKDTGKINLLNR
jgi:hypothetical protein